MSVINADTADSWRTLAAKVSEQRPSPGKKVKVTRGKHLGKVGIVLRHMKSKFGSAFRYGGEANLQLREMAGREGFTVQIQCDDKTESPFWVGADAVEVLSGAVS